MSWRVGVDVGGTFTDLVASDDAGTIVRFKVATTPRRRKTACSTRCARCCATSMPPRSRSSATPARSRPTRCSVRSTSICRGSRSSRPKAFATCSRSGARRAARSTTCTCSRPRPLARREDRLDRARAHRPRRQRSRRARCARASRRRSRRSRERGIAQRRGRAAQQLRQRRARTRGRRRRARRAARRRGHRVVGAGARGARVRALLDGGRQRGAAAGRARLSRAACAPACARSAIDAPIFVMQSNGGTAALDFVADRPATLVESGPASGVIAAAAVGARSADANVLSFDMGGTTAKAGTIVGGAAGDRVRVRSRRCDAQRTRDARAAAIRCAFRSSIWPK